MPQYRFECSQCRETFDLQMTMTEYAASQQNKTLTCPHCASPQVFRVFTAPAVTRSSGGAPSGGAPSGSGCGPGCCC